MMIDQAFLVRLAVLHLALLVIIIIVNSLLHGGLAGHGRALIYKPNFREFNSLKQGYSGGGERLYANIFEFPEKSRVAGHPQAQIDEMGHAIGARAVEGCSMAEFVVSPFTSMEA
eukprot:scaffold250272_cov42-Prasinocladus_malaysianus.AAC.2